MLRISRFALSALLVLVPALASQAAVDVFQDPTNVGTPGAAPVSVPVGGGNFSLNLFYQTGTTASAPSTVCLSGAGSEVCGWDIHVSTSSPSVSLVSFTPDSGVGSDIIANISGNVLRANGGNPIAGETGVHRIGTLVVSASAVGSVTVSGNLYVTAALSSAGVTTGNVLANAVLGPDDDGDGVPNAADNCVNVANPQVAADYLTTNTWATLTGGQRDDDHDGFGNRCDGDFTPTVTNVGPADLTQFRASLAKSRTADICGTSGVRPCAIFDLDGSIGTIGPADLTIFRSLQGKAAGPKCAACPLDCTAGTTGTCGAVPP